MIVRDFNYETRSDYAALWDLAKKMSVICILDSGIRTDGSEMTRDVAKTRWNGELMDVGVRGVGYFDATSLAEFSDTAARLRLEWIEPKAPAGDLTIDEICEVLADKRDDERAREASALQSFLEWIDGRLTEDRARGRSSG